MKDYADWTDSIELLGSEIQVPIDIQGGYIMVPIDLQGSYIQMPVDIQGQYITLDVNITASDVTLNVNISSQTANVTIDIKAQTVAIKSQGEWSSQQMQNVVAEAGGSVISGGEFYTSRTVTTGKTLYITHIGEALAADNLATDGDKNQMCRGYLWEHTAGVILFEAGGNGGFNAQFLSPIPVPSGHVVRLILNNKSGHTCQGYACINGYEV